MKTKRMTENCRRLHFWSENKSCYVVTDNIARAIKEMKPEYDECAIATDQSLIIRPLDRVLLYKSPN